MDIPFSVKVTFGNSTLDLPAATFSDLLAQTRNSFQQLPASFAFSLQTANTDSIIDSESKFQSLVSQPGLALTVREMRTVGGRASRGKPKTKIITGSPGMRLANRAFLNQKQAKEVVVDSPETVSDDSKCPICIEKVKKPMKAKCGHVCCLACWEKALERVLECPMCRGRVRMKMLRPV